MACKSVVTRKIFAFLASSLFAASLAAPVSATVLEIVGSEGGNHYAYECPDGQFEHLIGFAARRGLWIDQIQPMCAAFSPIDNRVTDSMAGPAFGGPGGGPRVETCPANAVLTGVRLGHFYDTGTDTWTYIEFVELHCTSLVDGAETTACIAGQSGCYASKSVDTNASDFLAGGKIFGGIFYPRNLTCPTGEAATGVYGRSGDFVDAVGLICGPKPAPGGAIAKPLILPPNAPIGNAPTPPAPPEKFVTVLLDTNVYNVPGGQQIGVLRRGTQQVTLVQTGDGGWFNLSWPAGKGSVWSGPGHESLALP